MSKKIEKNFEEVKESFFNSFLLASIKDVSQTEYLLEDLYTKFFYIKMESFSIINSFLFDEELDYEVILSIISFLIEHNIIFFNLDKFEYLEEIKSKTFFINIENDDEDLIEFLQPLIKIDTILNNILLHINNKNKIGKNKYEIELREIPKKELIEFISKTLSWLYLINKK